MTTITYAREERRVSRFRGIFSVLELPRPAEAALLAVRVVAGAAMMIHGSGKIVNPFGWMGPEGFAPAPLQALAAAAEFGGGLAWILGLLTPLASAGLVVNMATATGTHLLVRGDPFVARGGGPSAELAVLFLGIALLLLTLGPGRLSLDTFAFGTRRR